MLQKLAGMFAVSTLLHAQQQLGPRDLDRLPSSTPTRTVAYGGDPLQNADLRLPAGKGPFPVVIVIHGGCWTAGFATKRNTAALATALTADGYATWNIEYRQTGDGGGGWPGTFLDWARATDYLRTLAKTEPLDLAHVYTLGHSAGGHAALWIASRSKLAVTSEIRGGADPLPIRAAVSMDGPGDLRNFAAQADGFCGSPVVAPLMGGTSAQQTERYAQASPAVQLPLRVPQYMVQAQFVRASDAYAYSAAAKKAGDSFELLQLPSDGHFDIVAPGSEAWERVHPFLRRALR